MPDKEYFWTKNSDIIDDHSLNLRFEELLWMKDEEITEWVLKLRKKVIQVWDEKGIPPLNGRDREGIIEQFKAMSGENVKIFQRTDDLDGEKNVILNTSTLGPACGQFFPTMAKARIQHSTKKDDGKGFKGYSVYDIFKEDRFIRRMQLGCRRHFRRDSFYVYSQSIPAESSVGIIPAKTGADWCRFFYTNPKVFEDYGFWLNPVEESDEKGSGYTQTDASQFLTVCASEIAQLLKNGHLNKNNLTNIGKVSILSKNSKLAIRFYKKDVRLFPLGFKAFRIGYDNVAVNFPPMIAKFLYEKYTEHCKKQKVVNVYDPSSGWGGRILGAMAVNADRHLHYIGTDPNSDNYIPEIKKTRYEYIADFFNSNTISEAQRTFGIKNVNSFEVFQHGSEEIHKDPRFQKYKGKLDLVFTSPPYFLKEQYNTEETQSCVKFSTYDSWREGFLRPTLETAVKWLKPDRYLLWNIADINCNGALLPLEQDSREILESLGMKFVGIEKMCLANMPGANRIGADGKPTAKNFCKVDKKWRKYEPIFVFKKPKNAFSDY